ncbi:hypothetical protein BpHYR1_033469 [Brachionus plicatilis]|uniref:Uncharacterized protein n=1 Tax=Brachionus plicatilis TaxID=10195 RepID=A0A3M7STE5_BRAPC|nr:hypothetical protein BpHYR1_033469 [Brachionus plicatilis]
MLDNTLSMLELRLLFLCTSRRFELAVADEDDEADDELEFDSSTNWAAVVGVGVCGGGGVVWIVFVEYEVEVKGFWLSGRLCASARFGLVQTGQRFDAF